jgi:hypothetical protein
MKALVAGMVAGDPRQGGATWAVLQYVLGLERLGCEVMLVEPVAELSEEVVSYFRSLGLTRAALLRRDSRETVGVPYEAVADFDPDVLLNLSGVLREDELRASAAARVFVDLDPVFTQIWHAEGGDVGLEGHTHHATYGRDLAGRGLPVDREWIETAPPVVLEEWPIAENLEHDAFTTVGNWRSYGSVEWRGIRYGQRAHSVRRLLDLPALADQRLLPAFAIHPGETADLQALDTGGWELADPAEVAGSPEAYRRFVAGSKGEIGFAKAGYVDSRCGWFSDRSACYLASGRPVVAQDTGFGDWLPPGEGLLAFETSAEAARALDEVAGAYESHSVGARNVAEEWLDSRRVLKRLLEAVL